MKKKEAEFYKAMYYRLFNRITDALKYAEKGDGFGLCETLRSAQQETEEMYISQTAKKPPLYKRISGKK